MNRMALTVGIVALFVVAIVAWTGGCGPFRCATRALLGGALSFLGARIAFKIAAGIIADAVVKARMSDHSGGKKPNP